MTPRRFALLIPMVALLGCGTGRTIRVVESEETAGEPVALAPSPVPEPSPVSATEPEAKPSPPVEPSEGQGYAPYGGDGVMEIRRIGQWAHTGIGEPRRMVIRDANAWAQLWSELGAGERPDVDFTQNVVVVVAAGQRSTGGYGIAVNEVTQADGQLIIGVVETTPGPNCITTAAATQPADVVVIPVAAPRGWSFLERKEIRACR
jgi:hypothetical protein